MAKYKAYPEYKDSGVELLGEVPLTWRVFKLKFGLSEPLVYGANEAALDDNPDNPRYIRITDMNPDGTLRNDTFKSLPKVISEPYMLIDGDILLARSGATVGKSFYYKSIFGPSCFAGYLIRARFNSDKIIPRLAYWFFQSSIYWQYVSGSQIQATIQNVSAEKYSDLYLSAPLEYAEQALVADFLDHETAKIDNLIEKQQQLIELLKEKRQAVISHAVTKGLNPNVPMKASGVEWLGEVPKHWKCGYLRWYISVSSGTYLNNKEFETDESNDCMNPVIGGNGVMGFTSKTNDGNCLVVGRVGALCGNVHQIRGSCWVTDNALKITYGCDFDVDYLEMYLKVLDLNKLANHNAQPLITGTMIKEQVAIIPPIDEQKNITKFIQSKVGKIDLLILKSSEAVDKIKERRTALISAAVTGKIDVRDWVAPETQDIEESQEATA